MTARRKLIVIALFASLAAAGVPSGVGARTSTEPSEDAPLAIEVDHFLDGRRLPVERLAGRSGRLRVDVTIEIGTSTQTIPLEYVALVELEGVWHDVQAGNVAKDRVADRAFVVGADTLDRAGGSDRTLTFQGTSGRIVPPRFRVYSQAQAPGVSSRALDALRGVHGDLDDVGDGLGGVYDGLRSITEGLEGTLDGVGSRDPSTGEPVIALDDDGDPATLLAALGMMHDALADELLPGIGRRDAATGEAVVALDDDGKPTTAIGAIGLISDTLRTEILPSIGERDPSSGRGLPGRTLLGGLQSARDAYERELIPSLRTGLIPTIQGLEASAAEGRENAESSGDPEVAARFGMIEATLATVRTTGLSNPAFHKPQPEIDGRTPFAYHRSCPECFDPRSPSFDARMADPTDDDVLAPKFKPALVETLELFSAGTRDAIVGISSLDPSDPGLVEGLTGIADGLDDLNRKLHTLEPSRPGVVDGIEQVRDGLTALIGEVQTLDESRPGIVEALQMLRVGVEQASQGVLALDQLTVEPAHETTGDVLEDETTQDATFATAGPGTSAMWIQEVGGIESAGRAPLERGAVLALLAVAVVLLSRSRAREG